MFEASAIPNFLRKAFSRFDILIIVGLVILFLASRLIRLDQFPIFSDEGIYIHWAKVAWHDAAWRFISLTDGKQPLQTWGTIPFLKLFPSNALLGGRMFAVATGLFALSGMFSLLYYLWGKKAAFIGALLYILTPYFLFYDRMALVDSGVNAFFIWLLFFSLLLAHLRRLDVALLYGMLGGLALLSKSSVKIFIGLAAFAPILFFERNTKKFVQNTTNYASIYGIAVAIAVVIYNVQRLSPFFHYVSEKNKTFILTFDELMKDPFTVFLSNIRLIPEYVFSEMGIVLGVLGLIGLYLLYKKDRLLAMYLTVWLVIPFFIVAFVSKVLFPRYVIFFASLLTILATYFFVQIKNKLYVWIAVVLYALSVGYFNYTILFDPVHIPFPPIDRGQYVEGWPAGWGVKEIVQYAREKSAEKPVMLLAEGNFGLAGDVLDTHLQPGDRISVQGYWPLDEKTLLEHQKDLKDNHVYVVLSHQLEVPRGWPVQIIKKFEKPGGQSAIYLLELRKI
jgi:4-amino-4-deoxy-L-arabinose transferase-like glycosyltransferase